MFVFISVVLIGGYLVLKTFIILRDFEKKIQVVPDREDVVLTNLVTNNISYNVPLEGQKHGHRCYAEGLSPSERHVVSILSENLSHREYFIFNNLIIPAENCQSTQIDHIVVSRYGIFVIETKEFNGWIYPHKNRERWTVTYPSGDKHSLNNPVWQNYGHKEALKKILPFIDKNFFEIVVFTGKGTFKTPRLRGVLYDYELAPFIKKYSKAVVSEQRLLMAIGKLAYMCQAIDITPQQHIDNIRETLKLRNDQKIY